jgi:hypothetical protein
VRWARAQGDVGVAWWIARSDSSVVLRVARSHDDGAHWDMAPPADTLDRGVRACARPAPALALDPRSGYTHLAYYLEPATGAGLFYDHLADPMRRAPEMSEGESVAMFHAPVAIVYGEGAVEASVGGHGDTVVVAYQDPNGSVPRVALALSTTAGHTFPSRIDASGDDVAAREPVVAIDGATVAVAWRESSARSEGTDDRAAGRNVVRIGTVQ